MRITSGFLLCLCLYLTCALTSNAQTSLGTITGVADDEVTSSPIPGAVVELNDSSGLTRASFTDRHGAFTFLDLPPGSYTLTISKTRLFRPSEIRAISVPVSGLIIQNVTMRKLTDIWQAGRDKAIVSGPQTTVVPFYGPDVDLSRSAVIEQSARIQSQSEPSLSRDVSASELRHLPLLGRDPYALLVLEPGIASDLSTARGLSVSANGQRPSSSSFLLDGFQNNDYISTGLFAILPPEATGEYRLSTGNFSAEFGGTSGYIANAVSISGGNTFHAQLFGDATNQSVNAVDPQDRLSGPAPAQQLSTGGTVQMPLIKNRLFEAASFWLFRDNHSLAPVTSTIPSAAFLREIPPGSPLSEIFNLYPGPISPVSGEQGNFTIRPALSIQRIDALERVDWTPVNHRHHAFGRLIVDRLSEPQFIWSPNPSFRSGLDRDETGVGFAMTDTMSPHWSDEFRVGWSRDFIGWDRAHPDVPLLFTPAGQIGSPAGYTFRNQGDSLEIAANFAASEGVHSLGFGGSYLLRRLSPEFSTPEYFTYNFPSAAALLTGTPSSINLAVARQAALDGAYQAPNLARQYRYSQVGAYVEDSIRITSRLLFNAGLRYDFFGTPLNTGATPDTLVSLGPGSSIQTRLATASLIQERHLYDSDSRGFGPRFGLVYSLDKTGSFLFRASYGIFYDRPFDNLWLNISLNSAIGAAASPGASINYLAGPTTLTALLAPHILLNSTEFPLSLFQPRFRNPYAQNFFGGLQKSIGRSMLIEVEYAGSLGRELLTTDIVNRIGSTCPSAVSCRFNNAVGLDSDIEYRANQGFSNYHALVSSFLIRSRSLSAAFNYTWSHAIDNQSEPLAGAAGDLTAATQGVPLTTLDASFLRQFDSSADKGNSDFDQRHVFAAYLTWSVPRLRHSSLLRNWDISAVTSFRTGLPFTVYTEYEGEQAFNNVRADIVNPALATIQTAVPGGRLLVNAAAFATPDDGQIGSEGRNAFTGPGAYSADVSLNRTFRIPKQERWTATFRIDVFNILNHANLGNPQLSNLLLGSSPQLGLATYGRSDVTTGLGNITPISETARQLHLLLRLEF